MRINNALRNQFYSFITVSLVCIGLSLDALISIYRYGSLTDFLEPFIYLLFSIGLFSIGYIAVKSCTPTLDKLYLGIGVSFLLFCLKLPFIPFFAELNDFIYLSLFLFLSLLVVLISYLTNTSHLNIRYAWIAVVIVILYVPPVVNYAYLDHARPQGDIYPEPTPVILEDRPNIYLFSFDSLVQPNILEEYLKTDSTEYRETMMRYLDPIPNSWVNRVPSYPSLNSIMTLDSDTEISGGEFMGRTNSLLAEILGFNGYTLSTGAIGGYFGAKGEFIDRRISHGYDFSRSLLCLERSSLAQKARLLFYCEINERFPVASSMLRISRLLIESHTGDTADWLEKMVSEIKVGSLAASPQFKFFYTYGPMIHTPQDFNYDDSRDFERFRNNYVDRIPSLRHYLENIFGHIEKFDPLAIVLVFGDHGMFLSRHSKNELFKTRDQHQIFLGAWKSGHACNRPDIHTLRFEATYNTPASFLQDVLNCLAKQEILNIARTTNPNIIKSIQTSTTDI